MVKIGPSWVIVKQNRKTGVKSLFSLVSRRRTAPCIKIYLEQSYVDLFGSLEEKIAFKLNRSSWPYLAEDQGCYSGVIAIGHDPIITAYSCDSVFLKNGKLIYAFKTLEEVSSSMRAAFKTVTKELLIEPFIGST